MYQVPAERDCAHALFVTADGYERLRSELEILRTEHRGELSERLREARWDGDLDDNPALYDALEEQVQLEQRIAMLEGRLAVAQIAPSAADGTAGIGSRVRVRNLQTGDVDEYELVGAIEPDVGNGRVSVGAPVGRALVGHVHGTVVEVAAPRGTLRFEILGIRPVDGPLARDAA